jgi:hypothetical protein
MTTTTRRPWVARRWLTFTLLVGVVSTAACSTAATGGPTASLPSSQPPATPLSTAATTATALPTLPDFTAVPTSLDPCQLVTVQEASTLAGATFGAGAETTTEGNGKICTYGAKTSNVLNVDVFQAPDVATAQAAENAGLAAAKAAAEQQAPGLTFSQTELADFADGALVLSASMTISGQTVAISAIYVLSGTTFFAISDLVLGQPAPTSDALQAQAQVVLGRIG